ncbi:MAG: radical SAM protein [Sulfurovum sp.]|nr:radical SAM protein [Sulfurovaceae bacterium]
MKVIYEPKGRAREYSSLAINIINGCDMGCKYCYVPRMTFKKREQFHSNSKHRKDVLINLEKDLKELKKQGSRKLVMFSFTSDVYQLDDNFNLITRDALKLFRQYNHPFHLLTKGGLKAVRDFDLYSDSDWFACSLTFFDETKSKEIEPNAATPNERIESLKIAKQRGIKTWVSFEPTLEAEETFRLFEASKKYVDFYKIGKITGYKVTVDWEDFTNKIADLMEINQKSFFLKYDLRPYLKKDISEYKYHREAE